MTARAGLTVVGQVVGSYFGPVGAAIGGVIGSVIGGAIDGPVRTSQKMLDDLGAIKFSYGSTWPRIYGRYRVNGVMPIWSSVKRPIAHEEEQGKGGPSAVNTSYTYEMDWLCWAPLNAIGLSRIWINGELKYSVLADSDLDSLRASNDTASWASITFFDGAADQMPWPVYEADVGTENAVAYRHRPTFGIESLDLGAAGQPPMIDVEFFTAATESEAEIGCETFSLWRVVQHDWGPITTTDYIYGEEDDPPEVGAGKAAQAAQNSYESVWDDESRGPYLLDMPPAQTSPLGAPIAYDVHASTGGKVCSVTRLYLGLSSVLTVYEPQPVDLADIVRSEALLTWTGEEGAIDPDHLNTEEIEGIDVVGYATTGSPAEAIGGLMDMFYFGLVCGGDLTARLRGGAAIKTIPFDETGSGVDSPGEPFCGVDRGNDLEVAMQVAVTGPNVLTDYEPGTEISDRLIGESVELRRYTTAVVFEPAERKGRADTMVLDARIAANTATVALDDRHVDLECCDVVEHVDDEGNIYRLRIDRETYSQSGREFDYVLDDASILSTVGITSETDSRALTVATPSDTEALLLDIPILRDVDDNPGFYAVAKGSPLGATLFSSLDDVNYAQEVSIPSQSVFGVCTTALDDWTGGRVFDEVSAVTVDVGDGTLSNSTRDAMLADQTVNACAIGVHERWELMQFRTATLVGSGVYTLSGFLRGSRGTEWAMVDHEAGDLFALYSTNARRVSMEQSEIGVEQFWKTVSVGRALSSVSAEEFTDNAVGLKPFSPVDIRKSVDAVKNITLTWDRRTRRSTSFTGPLGIVVPLGEATESYEIDVVESSVVIRTITATSETCTYTAVQQTTDGVDSGSAIRFDVYQMSAVVGRGYVGSLTSAGAVTPLPQITTLTVGGSFATGAALYATLAGVTYNHTSVGGDTNLDGIATSFASIIDAAAAYTAVAAGSVITVTGAVSAAFPVVAGVSAGDNTTTWNLTQTASDTVAGVGNQIYFGWKNLGDPGGANAYPFGTLFNLLVQRVDPPLNLLYSVTNADAGGFTDYRILPGLIGAIGYAVRSTGDDVTYGFSLTANDLPNGTSTLTTPASEPYNWTLQVSASVPAVSGLSANAATGVTPATLRPQIVTLTLAGTPVTGNVYRATLGGVNLDYTATGGDTTMALVATGLAGVIDAHGDYIASAVGAVITITHTSNNVPFTYSAQIIASAVTLTAATTQEAA